MSFFKNKRVEDISDEAENESSQIKESTDVVIVSDQAVKSMFKDTYLSYIPNRDESYISWVLTLDSIFEPVISKESKMPHPKVSLPTADAILSESDLPVDYIAEKQTDTDTEELIIL